MREKLIGWSIASCFVLGVLYLKNKVFVKKLPVVVDEEPVEEEKSDAGKI